MATLSPSPSCLSCASHRLFWSRSTDHRQFRLNLTPHLRWKCFTFTICACSGDKSSSRSSSSRKVMSNEQLLDEIREFLSSVGLPMAHVPSMKELSEHGRSDLANIVRRRGYKLLRELLTSSAETDAENEKVDKSVEEVSSSLEVSSVGNNIGTTSSSSNLLADCQSSTGMESSANLALNDKGSSVPNDRDEIKDSIIESTSLSNDALGIENLFNVSSVEEGLNLDDLKLSVESSLEETDPCSLVGQHARDKDIAENVYSPSNELIVENYYDSSTSDTMYNLGEQHYTQQITSAPTRLEDKVANFIQNGDLDMVEDNVDDLTKEFAAKESTGVTGISQEEGAIEGISKTLDAKEFGHPYGDGADGTSTSNGGASMSKEIDPAASVNYSVRGDHTYAGGQIGENFDEDSVVEINKRENLPEINHLRLLLHQKELELSRLKEQIEREKHALSVLQTEAETEINKAQKLLSEKDAELLAAEESLSGLEEVQLQYSGDGDIVEVAGSFNGWHQLIKMDPQPSSIIEPLESRKSRLWSTVLWLYPGTYEIKFIVDGQWRIDPQRETVSRGGISNNILRVKR